MLPTCRGRSLKRRLWPVVTETKHPQIVRPAGTLFWRRPIDSFAPGHSPFGLPSISLDLRSVSRLPSALLEQASPKGKNPDDKFTGVFVLATSYSRTAFRRTTIGAAAFHFRVRNGNGWCHHANVTRAEKRLRCSALVCDSRFVRYIGRFAHRSGYSRFTILGSRFRFSKSC